MDVDSDMAVSINWRVPYKGFRAPFKEFGVDIRPVAKLFLIRTIWPFPGN